MNEKLATQIEKALSQTYGVEVEMNNITREKAAKTAATFFGTGRYEYTAHRNGYETWSAWDAEGREFKFSKDVSIAGPDSQKCELVTPILRYSDLPLLQELIRQLRHAGAKSSPSRGCGIHIHCTEEGHTPQSLRNLVNIMASHEQLLIGALGIDSYRTARYCKTVDPHFLEQVNKKKPKSFEQLSDIWYTTQGGTAGRHAHYHESRYTVTNLHSFFTGKGIEFRLFQFDEPCGDRLNGLNAGQLKAYIQLCLLLCQMAKEVKTASARPQQKDNPRYAMRTWLLRLGFIGDEFKTAREVLTKRLPGDASFRNGRTAL